MNQLVLPDLALSTPKLISAHATLIPSACVLVSIVLLLFHVVYLVGLRAVAEDDNPYRPIAGQHTRFFQRHGGGVVLTWKVLRLLACMTLTALTIVAIISVNEGHKTPGVNEVDTDVDALTKRNKKYEGHWKKQPRWSRRAEWVEISLCMFYTYTTLLAIFALALGPRLRAIANIHLVVLLLVALGVYVWRDLVPFATFKLSSC